MIPPIRRQPVPLECATPPGPARPRTSKSGPARPGRTPGIASDLTPHHPLRADPPPLNHILMRKTHSAAGSPASGPSSFASAQVSSRTRRWAVRVRLETCALAENRGRPGGTRGRARPPGPARAPRSSPGCAPAGPEGSSGRAPGPAGLSRRAPGPLPDPRTPSPADPRTLAVKICHKDLDRAGARQKKR